MGCTARIAGWRLYIAHVVEPAGVLPADQPTVALPMRDLATPTLPAQITLALASAVVSANTVTTLTLAAYNDGLTRCASSMCSWRCRPS